MKILKKKKPICRHKENGKSVSNEDLKRMLKKKSANQIIAMHMHNVINLKSKQLDDMIELKNS